MKISNEKLFLQYALPCGHVLVERGDISERILNDLESKLNKGEQVGHDISKIFKVAYAMCVILAKRLGKKEIDDDVIRKYFWFEHDKAVEWRYGLFHDFDPELCKLQPGVVLKTGDDILVKLPLMKERVVKKSFVDVSENDKVILHYGYIIERIDVDELWFELWSLREAE